MKASPKLQIMVSTWTMIEYPNKKSEWSPERKVKEAVAAGFDGIVTRVSNPVATVAFKKGVRLITTTDIGSVKEVEKKFKEIKSFGIKQVNVQMCDDDTPTEKALPVAIQVIKVGEKLGLVPAIEVHRDTCTETPEKAFALADAYQKKTGRKLRMNFDHSHPAIIKHLAPDAFWPRMGVRLDLLCLGEQIHFRPFNGHHCQIPVTNGRGKLSPEFQDWLPFCEKVIEAWLKKAKPGQEFFVVPELGPKAGGYALSNYPDVWKDVQVLTKEIRRIWHRQIKRWKK
jgi:hypothetical protein